jgi:Bacterial lipid A biosynthesis acyltransferase
MQTETANHQALKGPPAETGAPRVPTRVPTPVAPDPTRATPAVPDPTPAASNPTPAASPAPAASNPTPAANAAVPLPASTSRTRELGTAVLRRALPTRLLVQRTQARASAAWEHDPLARRLSLAVTESIVGGTPRAGELEALAREHLVEQAVNRTLFWQPWKMPSMDARSTENVRLALSSDRGVLVSSCHLGPFFLQFWPLSTMRSGYAIFGPWFFEQPTADYAGRRLARWRKGLEPRDERLLPSQGVFVQLRGLLAQGEMALMYFDMPGSRHTRFLGKPVMLATGTARLALDADALVLPIRARREGHRVWTDVQAPLDSRDFSGYEQLQDALAGVHERWILERPGALEDPNRRGAWEGSASASAWTRPERLHERV